MIENPIPFNGYQKLVIAALSFLQFTVILDFMIMSPLGAILMPSMQITASQFGKVVSVYAVSAGLSGFIAAGFADRFDRKSLLFVFYTGFLLGTLFCGLAKSYEMLLLARMVTGMFGGVIGSVILAIATDLFPLNQRGRVLGFIQTAFAGSQVLGIPLGLYFATHWGWHIPFFVIVLVGSIVGIVLFLRLKPIRSHLEHYSNSNNPIVHLWRTLVNPKFTLSFIVMTLLNIGGFMIMPFSSAFVVGNLKIDLEHLPFIYLATGIATLFIAPLVGRLSDRLSKYSIFTIGGVFTSFMVVVYTNLTETPLWLVVVVNILLFVGIFSRAIPAQALITSVPGPNQRGAFMSIIASLRQLSGGMASYIAGLIVIQNGDQSISNFDIIGYIVAATSIFTIGMMYFVSRSIQRL